MRTGLCRVLLAGVLVVIVAGAASPAIAQGNDRQAPPPSAQEQPQGNAQTVLATSESVAAAFRKMGWEVQVAGPEAQPTLACTSAGRSNRAAVVLMGGDPAGGDAELLYVATFRAFGDGVPTEDALKATNQASLLASFANSAYYPDTKELRVTYAVPAPWYRLDPVVLGMADRLLEDDINRARAGPLRDTEPAPPHDIVGPVVMYASGLDSAKLTEVERQAGERVSEVVPATPESLADALRRWGYKVKVRDREAVPVMDCTGRKADHQPTGHNQRWKCQPRTVLLSSTAGLIHGGLQGTLRDGVSAQDALKATNEANQQGNLVRFLFLPGSSTVDALYDLPVPPYGFSPVVLNHLDDDFESEVWSIMGVGGPLGNVVKR